MMPKVCYSELEPDSRNMAERSTPASKGSQPEAPWWLSPRYLRGQLKAGVMGSLYIGRLPPDESSPIYSEVKISSMEDVFNKAVLLRGTVWLKVKDPHLAIMIGELLSDSFFLVQYTRGYGPSPTTKTLPYFTPRTVLPGDGGEVWPMSEQVPRFSCIDKELYINVYLEEIGPQCMRMNYGTLAPARRLQLWLSTNSYWKMTPRGMVNGYYLLRDETLKWWLNYKFPGKPVSLISTGPVTVFTFSGRRYSMNISGHAFAAVASRQGYAMGVLMQHINQWAYHMACQWKPSLKKDWVSDEPDREGYPLWHRPVETLIGIYAALHMIARLTGERHSPSYINLVVQAVSEQTVENNPTQRCLDWVMLASRGSSWSTKSFLTSVHVHVRADALSRLEAAERLHTAVSPGIRAALDVLAEAADALL